MNDRFDVSPIGRHLQSTRRPFAPLTASAFSAKVALACEVVAFRIHHTYALVRLWNGRIKDLAVEAGKRLALEGGQLESPLVDGAEASCRGVRRLFEMSFWLHHPALEPEKYFELTVDARFVRVASRGVACGDGEVTLHERQVRDFFWRLRDAELDSYEAWATNPYPVGGHTVLYRKCRLDDEEPDWDDYDNCDWYPSRRRAREPRRVDPHEGMVVIDPDAHPSSGRLVFGKPDQELQQLAALARLHSKVRQLLAKSTPTAADRQAAAARAAQINARMTLSFMPPDGFCECCGSDVTLGLLDRKAGDAITGCPCCGRSWCD